MAKKKDHAFVALLDEDIRRWGAGAGVPSRKDLDRLESDLGFSLPEEYRRFQLLYGATMVAADDDIWPDGRANSVGPYWTFLKGFIILGLGEGAPDHLDIRVTTTRFHEEFPDAADLVPFFCYANDADFHCFDAEGRLHSWSHEQPETTDVLEVGFDEFLLAETRHLVARKEAIKRSRATSRRNWRDRAEYPERDS